MPRSSMTSLGTKDWRLPLATAIWSGLIVIAVVLASRKLAGALSDPVSALAACVVTTAAVGLSLLAHLLFAWAGSVDRRGMSRQITAGVVTLVPPFAVGTVLLPGPSMLAVSYLTALFLFTSTFVLLLDDSLFRSVSIRPTSATDRRELKKTPFEPAGHAQDAIMPSAIDQALSDSVVLPAMQDADELPFAEDSNRSVSQWMTRSVTDEGQECIEGAVQVHFDPGQKQAMIHLPFCPPLLEQPAVECEVLSDAEVRFKIGAVHPYGARIEARRTGPIENAETVEVGFSAIAAAAQEDAA